MRTIRLALGDELLRAVDMEVRKLDITRSMFARNALEAALRRIREEEMDRRFREGYLRRPVTPDEFGNWEAEQVWRD